MIRKKKLGNIFLSGRMNFETDPYYPSDTPGVSGVIDLASQQSDNVDLER